QSLRLDGSTMPTLSQDNINVQPVYADCGPGCLDRVPVLQSPLVNAGIEPATLGLSWTLPLIDAAGSPRRNGPHVDIGAYEATEALFFDRFED
ncbi:MAG: choice-of-anchor Q domain-containing protein, partial [Wenzhouxiangella sp.]|nr:choice-of-anchor Q domain-containing protein [Wenzhouxiangella sp.]